MTDRCKNSNCGYASTCEIRRTDAVGTKNENVPTPSPPSPSPPSRREPWRDPVQFSVLPADNGAGWIGTLSIRGRLGDTHKAMLLDVADDIFSMNGIFLRLNTPGGDGLAGVVLHSLVTMAREKMPVVGFAHECCSAGVLPLAACDAAFAHPHGALGCFGRLTAICDGTKPRVMTSAQSPKKWNESAPMPPWLEINYARNGDGRRIQESLDAAYSRDLSQLSVHTGTAPDRLRCFMDGRILSPRQARRLGLVNEICEENKAYEALLEMVKKSVKTNT